MDSEKRNASKDKMSVIKGLQLMHQTMSSDLKDNLMSPNQHKRAEFTRLSKKPISLVDLQDVPDGMSDQEILYLIGSLLAPDQMDQIVLGRDIQHTHLLYNEQTQCFQASPGLMVAFQGKLKNAISDLLNKGFNEKHFNDFKKIFLTDSSGNIKFNSFGDILQFIRKTNIKNNDNLTEQQKTKSIYIACSLLREMVRNQDFKNNKKEVRRIQDATDKFFKNHIQPLFSHRVPIDDSIIVTDETDIRFLDDKYFKFDDFLLKKYDIKSNEMLLKMSYRAKIDKSINDKNMINPTTSTLNSIHDLGGIKTLLHGDSLNDDDLLVGYYGIFKIIMEYSETYHPDLYKIAPSNNGSFKKDGLYDNYPDLVKKYLDVMSATGDMFDKVSPLVKDKGFLPIKKNIQGSHYIDEQLLERLGIDDIRFLYLLKNLCKQKDFEYKQKQEERGREEEQMKKSVFESLMSTVADRENIENINSIPESIRYLIKNYENIVKKKIKPQEGERRSIGKDLFLTKENGLLYFVSPTENIKISFENITKYKNLFISQREEEKKIYQKQKESHKGVWPDSKISFKVFIDGKFVNIEWQIGKEQDIKNIPLMDEHSIYGPSKQLLVYGRNSSGVLTIHDIEDIVDNQIIKVWDKNLDYKLENGFTHRQMKELIETDDKILPIGHSFKEKIIYNFTHERGLKKKENLYYTQYYDNLQSHGLAI